MKICKKLLLVFILPLLFLAILNYLALLTFGTEIITRKLEKEILLKSKEAFLDNKDIKRAEPDPDYPDNRITQDSPYYYIKVKASPLPFVVKVHYEYQFSRLDGEGKTEYYLWIFGIKIKLKKASYWVS